MDKVIQDYLWANYLRRPDRILRINGLEGFYHLLAYQTEAGYWGGHVVSHNGLSYWRVFGAFESPDTLAQAAAREICHGEVSSDKAKDGQ